MKISKKALIGIILCIALLSGVLVYCLTNLYTLQNTMTITTYKEVQVENPFGTKVTSYNWGNFSKSNPDRTETFYLRSFSNVALNVTWNVNASSLDVAFTFALNTTTFNFTSYNQVIPFEATLTLIDYSKAPGSFGFNLDFGEE